MSFHLPIFSSSLFVGSDPESGELVYSFFIGSLKFDLEKVLYPQPGKKVRKKPDRKSCEIGLLSMFIT